MLVPSWSWFPSFLYFYTFTIYLCIHVHCVCSVMSTPMLLVAREAPLSMEFSRQENWSRLPWPPPGIFLTQGLKHYLLHPLYWRHLGRALPLAIPGKSESHPCVKSSKTCRDTHRGSEATIMSLGYLSKNTEGWVVLHAVNEGWWGWRGTVYWVGN